MKEKAMLEEIIENCISPLLEGCDDWYSWKIPASLASRYNLGNGTAFQKTLRLKEILASEYKHVTTDEERIRCVNRVIADWGGIRGNKESNYRYQLQPPQFPKESLTRTSRA